MKAGDYLPLLPSRVPLKYRRHEEVSYSVPNSPNTALTLFNHANTLGPELRMFAILLNKNPVRVSQFSFAFPVIKSTGLHRFRLAAFTSAVQLATLI